MERRAVIFGNHDYNFDNFEEDIVESCTAIFLHNIRSSSYIIDGLIDFTITPIAFTLYLCDTIQEWDRKGFLADGQERAPYYGKDFSIFCEKNSISIKVHSDCNDDISEKLRARLTGIDVFVNGIKVVFRHTVIL